MSSILRPPQAAPVPVVQLVVMYNPATQHVDLAGPLQNEILCLGILDKAKDAVKKYNRELREGAVEQAPPGLKIH